MSPAIFRQGMICQDCGAPFAPSIFPAMARLGIWVPTCACMIERLQNERSAYARTDSDLARGAGVPETMAACTFEGFGTIAGEGQDRKDRLALAFQVEAWASDKTTRRGILLLAGDTGTGKTGLAVSALVEIVKAGHSARYVYAYDLISNGVNFETRQQALTEALEPGLLVIDEIGVQMKTEAALAFLERVLVGRHEDGKATILVTNEQPEVFWQIVGERVKDRILGVGMVVAFTGRSLRDAVAARSEDGAGA